MPETEGGSTFDGSTVEGSFLTRTPAPAAALRLAATLLCHPDPARVGERALLGAWPTVRAAAFSRLEPRFYPPAPGGAAPPGAPLGDRQLSREPWRLLPAPGGLELDPGGCPHPLRLDRRPVEGRTAIAAARLETPGLTLEIGDRVALLLHLVQLDEEPAPDGELVGASGEIVRLRRQVARIGPAPWPVLLRGETGTGKELVARALHQASGRPGPFLAVNLAALPAELAAAELFGNRRGAFTGAGADRRGLCAAADRGTLFLDEIGEAPLELQAMLLRTLETGEILPLGSDKPQKVDLRFLAATDADLEQLIEQGRFRAPLLHRLGGLQLRVMDHPPGWFWVADETTVALPLTWGEAWPTSVIAVRSRAVAGMASWLFERLWERAVPVRTEAADWDPLLLLMDGGATLEAAARALGISERTGRRRVSEAMEHFGVSSMLGLGVAWGDARRG